MSLEIAIYCCAPVLVGLCWALWWLEKNGKL